MSRLALVPLDKTNDGEAVLGEIIVDNSTGHFYIKDSNTGVIKSITLDNDGRITALETANVEDRVNVIEDDLDNNTITVGYLVRRDTDGHILLPNADPVSNDHATRKLYVDDLFTALQNDINDNPISLDKLIRRTTDGHVELPDADPSDDNYAVRKLYIDTIKKNLPVKDSARVISFSNVDITTGGLIEIDGVTVEEGDRVVLAGQTNMAENGIYSVSAGAWNRTEDFNANSHVINGALVFITEGAVEANSGWILDYTGDPVIGTTDFEFVRSSSGNWLIKDASTDTGFEVGSEQPVIITGDNLITTTRSGETISISHDESGAVNSSNTGRTYIQSITTDTSGHITSIEVSSETVVNTDTSTTATSDILEAINDNFNITYQPYTSRSAGVFYTGTTEPTNNNRLNYDGYFHATRLYDNGVRVSTTDHSHAFQVINNILEAVNDGLDMTYRPYGTKAAGVFYTGTTNPTSSDRLNYDGHFYATNLYDNGNRVSVSDTPTTAISDILKAVNDGFNITYEPYSVRTAGTLYTGTTNPTNTNRLNYDGYFYSTRLYDGGTRVSVVGHNHDDLYNNYSHPAYTYSTTVDDRTTEVNLVTTVTDTNGHITDSTYKTLIGTGIITVTDNADGTIEVSSTQHTLDNDILEAHNDGFISEYKPYTTAGAGRLYSGTDNPTNTDRLNYDGYFYATRLYDSGKRVSTTDHSHDFDKYTSWTVSDGTNTSDINSGNTAGILGGTYISTSLSNQDLTINHDDTTRDDTSDSSNVAFADSFTAIDSVTTNDQGHVTGVNTKTVSIPSNPNTDTATTGVNNILEAVNSEFTMEYRPYTSRSAAGIFYTGTTNPINDNRLNYDGYFYATRLYDGGTRVSVVGHNHDSLYNNYSHPTYDGDDFSIDTGHLSGATVIDDIDINVSTDTLGHVTEANATVATRDLTLSDLGYTGATDANKYSHPTYAGDDFSVDSGALSGATVISDIDINVTTDSLGHVTDANGVISTRNLTYDSVDAVSSSENQTVTGTKTFSTSLRATGTFVLPVGTDKYAS